MKSMSFAAGAALAACAIWADVAIAQDTSSYPPLSQYFAPASAAATTPDEDGFIRRWMLAEPIPKPNSTNQLFVGSYINRELDPSVFPGSFGSLPTDGQTAAVAGETLRWHALDSRLWDVKLFNFAQALDKPKYGVLFWAVTVVDAPREMPGVRLAAGSNSASRWWVNGEEVATLVDDKRMVMDDVLSPRITLKKGRNVITGAVINGPGLSDFCIRFVDEKGQPIRDLSIDIK